MASAVRAHDGIDLTPGSILPLVGLYACTYDLGYSTALNPAFVANEWWFAEIGIKQNDLLLGIVLAMHVFGTICSAVPAPYLSDKIGRRKALLVAGIVKICATIGEAFTTNVAGFIATRFLDGFATLPMVIYSDVLLVELSPSNRRGLLVGLWNACAPLGGLVSALIVYGSISIPTSWSWRLPVILEIVPAVALICSLPFIPESPRWLAMRARRASIVSTEMTTKDARFTLPHQPDQEQIPSRQIFLLQRQYWRPSFLVFLLAVIAQWSGNSAVSSYLPRILAALGVVRPSQQLGINCGVQAVNFVAASIGALIADQIGRRMHLLISSSGVLISIVVLTVCLARFESTPSQAYAAVGITFILMLFISTSMGLEPIAGLYVAELFPTEYRAKATSLFFGALGASVCINIFTTPLALDALHWRFLLVSIAASAVVVISLALIAAETKSVPLENVAAVVGSETNLEVLVRRTSIASREFRNSIST